MNINKAGMFVLIIILGLSFVIAQSNSSNQSSQTQSSQNQGTGTIVDQAYQCLEDQISSKDQSSLSLQESIFGVLALGPNSKLTSVIEDKKQGDFWKETSSGIKDTSQVLLAYDRINLNTEDIESWILSKEITATDLTWYLQIDIPSIQESECTISYNNEQRTITVNTDQTLSGSPGSCLSISPSGYWLRVNNNCVEETFTTVCNKDFVTSLLYQRSSAGTIFVSPTTHSASALGTTEETINSKCISEGNSCDYEGTLWATLALDASGNDISTYLPYLLALSESNQRYLPSAFLHKITSGSDQYSQVVQLQQQEQYWQAPNTPYNRFYDSALAMLSLQSTGAIELSNSQSYFEGITTPEGCWNNNNIRDTAFLLYGGWPRAVSSVSNPTTPPPTQTCETQGFSCVSSLFVCDEIGGTVLSESCTTGVCCSEAPQQQSCSAQSGVLCSSGETCSGTTTSSSDGSCCLGSCNPLPTANECETQGGSCYSSCNEDEDQLSFSCENSELCCIPKSENSSSSGISTLTIWIIIISILILGAIIAIIIIKRRRGSGNKKSKGPRSGLPPGRMPPFPPGRGPIPLRGPGPRRITPNNSRGPHRTSSKSDKELEETMKKLREIGK